jgi:hypothetical protein
MSTAQLLAVPDDRASQRGGSDSRRPNQLRVRFGAVAFAVAGVLLLMYPAVRPFSDETSLQAARAFTSDEWTIAHVLGMLGFIGVSLGLLGLHLRLAGTPAAGRSFWALVLSWIGTGLTLTYYGAETYGLRAIGREALSEHNAGLVSLAHQVRFGPGAVMFGAGMVLIAAAGITAAAAAWRLGSVSRWGSVLLAAGLALYIPQFWAGQTVRIAHGLLIAAGCLLLAAGLWRRQPRNDEAEGVTSQQRAEHAVLR